MARVDASGLDARWRTVELRVVCDVDNPLLGQTGAVAVYGPQKGANEDGVRLLEANLRHLTGIFKQCLGVDVRNVPGAGAAGRARAEQRFSLDAMVQAYLGVYDRLCETRG